MTCQGAGFLASYLGTLTITLRQDCETTPAIEMELHLPSGDAIIDQLITSPMQISRSISFVTVSLDVFVNHSANSLGFAVRTTYIIHRVSAISVHLIVIFIVAI